VVMVQRVFTIGICRCAVEYNVLRIDLIIQVGRKSPIYLIKLSGVPDAALLLPAA
jgi:hypothetical protein